MTASTCPRTGARTATPTSNEAAGAASADRRLRSLGALAAGFGAVSLSLAQTAAPTPGATADSTSTMPSVTVRSTAEPQGKESYQATTTRIGKGEQDLRDVPQSVTVVTERLIDDRNLDTLKDTLRNTAGISFLAAEGGEEDIRLRGFSLQTTGDIFIDGLRDPAFYERDTFNMDRVEVLRGSASMLFGRGSTGGAVNQVSKQPRLLTGHQAEVTVGSGDEVRAVGDLNFRTGENAAVRVAGMVDQGDGYGVKTDKVGFAPTLRWGIGTAHEFSVGYFHLENDNGVNYGMPWLQTGNGDTILVPVDPKNYYGAASDYSASTADFGTLTYTHRFLDGGQWRSAFRAGRFDRDQRASAIRFCQPNAQTGLANPLCPAQLVPVTAANLGDDTILTRGSQNKIQDLRHRALQSDYSRRFTALGVEHSLLTGFDLTTEDFVNYAATVPDGVVIQKPTTTIGTPDDGGRVDESLRAVNVNRTFESKAMGLYLQDRVQVAPAWKLLAGIRWDRFEGDYWAAATTGANPQPAASRSRTDRVWSKRFGVLYQPTATQSYHVSYGTSFNTSGDAYQYDALGANTPPEKSRNIEIGAKLDAESGNASMRIALFHSTKYNERNQDDDSANETNYLLSGERHAAGVELDLAGRLTPAWEAFVSYAWIPDAKIDKGAPDGTTLQAGELVGARPGLTPKHSASLWTTYRVLPAWRVGGGLNARYKMRALQSTNEAPSWVSFDLMTEYTAGPVSYKLNVVNVGNKLYADNLYRGHYIVGQPRTLQLTVAASF